MTKDEAKQFRRLLESQSDRLSDVEILQVPAFVKKWVANSTYETGNRINYNDTLYKCLQDHTAQSDWTPDVAPSLWAKILIPDQAAIPEWVQPDSTNAYAIGDKVTHNGKTWVSTVADNVWEPGVYGWDELT